MSATDEHEIKLEPRYPESRHEDIIDAFMRGHLKACETSFKAIEELEAMNKRLRKENDTLCRRIDELCRENEKLMGELADWERLAAGIELPEYPITQFQPKDLEREIAELREFAEQYAFYKEVEKGIHPDLKAHEEVLRRFAAKLQLRGDAE